MRPFIFCDAEDGLIHRANLLTDRRAGVSFVQNSCGLRRTWWVQVLPEDTSITCSTFQKADVFTRFYVRRRR